MIIILRTFRELLTDAAARRRQLRNLPFSDTVGEWVVLQGSSDLPAESTVSVPWEGVLGSVRSADVFIPGSQIARKHLSFYYQPNLGLCVHPFSGKEAYVNGNRVDCRTLPRDAFLRHGDCLQVGEVLLRLRMYAGLDSRAGFEEPPLSSAPVFPGQAPMETNRTEMVEPPSALPDSSDTERISPPDPVADRIMPENNHPVNDIPSRGKRRQDRWEADWSE